MPGICENINLDPESMCWILGLQGPSVVVALLLPSKLSSQHKYEYFITFWVFL